MTLPEGILLIDKPKGITSFAVVGKIRKKLNERKVGHAGTLDPLASGLMIVGYGKGTKLLHGYVSLPKVYEAEICIGEKSETGDAEGKIIEKKSAHNIDAPLITAALSDMIGVLRLPVSAYSAMKQGGEALYKKVRRGEKVTIPLRDMEVFSCELLETPIQNDDTVHIHVRFSVGSGTYIRSLAEALGNRLGYPARLENLRRTQVGEFSISDAEPIE